MSKSIHLFGWEQEPVDERRPDAAIDPGARTAAYSTTVASARVARAAVDDAARLRRDAPNPRDMTLSALASAWRDAMPAGITPDALCTLYPRIANRLALCWKDADLSATLLDQLLGDSRGGRRGFPTLVRRELVSLRKALDPATRR